MATWNVRNETRHDISQSASLRYVLLRTVTRRLISDVPCSHKMTKLNIQFLDEIWQ